MRQTCIMLMVVAQLGFPLAAAATAGDGNTATGFSFTVAGDVREFADDNPAYFRGVCEAMAEVGPGLFLVGPGDNDPPAAVASIIAKYLGPEVTWYPVVGNHEVETDEDMAWLRGYNSSARPLPRIVNHGPAGCEETTYSFDQGPIHFVVLNQYYDGKSDRGLDGQVSDALYQWLVEDLQRTRQPLKLVIGHEPAYPARDQSSGRYRHQDDSLNQYPENRNRFWKALREHRVLAYICGHTHNYSKVKIDGVWQIDAGHARGAGDTGSRSTFVRFTLTPARQVQMEVYRMNDHRRYVRTESGVLQ